MQVKRVEVIYDNFDQFTKDQEFLISKGMVDYIEGFINNIGGSQPSYSIELAIYYDDESIAQNVCICSCHIISDL